jgi:hypothetical protein
MTKILVLSDSHGHVTAIKNAVRREKPDVVIFLGDCVPDMLEAAEDFPGLDVRCVRGNCDTSLVAPDRMRTNVGGVEILAVHGHAEGVKLGLLRLALAAEEAGCRAAFFGHTHLSYRGAQGGVTLVNPGALCDGSYGVFSADDGVLRELERTR